MNKDQPAGPKDGSYSKVAVIGQGYVGLPLALLFVKKGLTVYGIDVDKKKIDALAAGSSYLPDVKDEELEWSKRTGRFQATTGFEAVREADVIVICVPTPLTAAHTPNLVYLQDAASAIAEHLRKDQLIILESSTFPGTTREVLGPLLERASGLKAGEDFYLGYSPERIDPGNKQYNVEQIPKLVSGLTEQCLSLGQSFYKGIFEKVVPVSSPEVAEMTKLMENAHRLINITFTNEIAMLCDRMNIDIWEVIDAAKTKPFGFTAYYPGPGIGGHCIPVDPLYLQWKAERYGMISRFIQLSDEVNHSMPAYIAARVRALVAKKTASGVARILLYGVAYKKDINDVRESPALDLIQLLEEEGVEVGYHDPFVAQIKVKGSTMNSLELTEETLRAADCVIIFTDHTQMPLQTILMNAPLVFDTRNATAGQKGYSAQVYRLGSGS